MPAQFPGWGRLRRRTNPVETATELYGRLVAQARAAPFYSRLGVPDTLEGRFELVLLHMVLVVRRLQREDGATAELARTLAETFVTDMDDSMREMGVSDLTVAKKVKKAAAALYDRMRDYGARIEAADLDGLAAAITAHVGPTETPPEGTRNARRLAGYALAAERALAASPSADLLAGRAVFPTPDGED